MANSYNIKTGTLIYEPNNKHVKLKDITVMDKYRELIKSIDNSNVSDEEKLFLKMSATRHIVFRYDKIADYYANQASPEMQRLMEESALVILDIDKAIENGYCKLSGDIARIMGD